MVSHKQSLIDEQTSPLHRIMWVYNPDEPQRRSFENNICAFHIGKGYFLSVAHNLRIQAGFYRSIEEEVFKNELFPILDGSQTRFLNEHYFTDEYTGKRYMKNVDADTLQKITAIMKQKRFDSRWVTLAEKKICKPHLVFQFKSNNFYGDPSLADSFRGGKQFYDGDAQKYTFLVEVELVHAFYSADIALYRVVNMPDEVISRIPGVTVNYDFMDETAQKFYCLQSSPSGPTGRLLNEAHIEGILDHFGIFPDDVGGNYLFDGYRYLIKGYFRFGSSGAPYLFYDEQAGKYMVNAVQSEASGIQLSIKNDRDGNFQYINAIASPLYIIREELEMYLR